MSRARSHHRYYRDLGCVLNAFADPLSGDVFDGSNAIVDAPYVVKLPKLKLQPPTLPRPGDTVYDSKGQKIGVVRVVKKDIGEIYKWGKVFIDFISPKSANAPGPGDKVYNEDGIFMGRKQYDGSIIRGKDPEVGPRGGAGRRPGFSPMIVEPRQRANPVPRERITGAQGAKRTEGPGKA